MQKYGTCSTPSLEVKKVNEIVFKILVAVKSCLLIATFLMVKGLNSILIEISSCEICDNEIHVPKFPCHIKKTQTCSNLTLLFTHTY